MLIVLVIFLIGRYIFYSKLPQRQFQTRIIRKEKESFRVMGAANKVTSYHLTITNDDLQIVKVRVLNPALFEKINEGETGTVVLKGNILVSFTKQDYSHM